MKRLNYIFIAGGILIFAACKKAGSGSGNLEVRVSSSAQLATTNVALFGSDPSNPIIDTTSASVSNFDYTFKASPGQTVELNVNANGPTTLSVLVFFNGQAVAPFSGTSAPDGSSGDFVYGVP